MSDEQKIVYFAGAIRGERTMADAMIEIVRFIKSLGFPVLSEHVGTPDPIATLAAKLGKTKETLAAEDIEKQDIEWLDQATHVIAEISGGSTGTGREIEYARTKGQLGKTPAYVLCLYHNDREFYASPMIRGMRPEKYSNVSIKKYKDVDEAKQLVKEFLEAY